MNKTVSELHRDLELLEAFKDTLWNNYDYFCPMNLSPVNGKIREYYQNEIAKCDHRIANIKKLLEDKRNVG